MLLLQQDVKGGDGERKGLGGELNNMHILNKPRDALKDLLHSHTCCNKDNNRGHSYTTHPLVVSVPQHRAIHALW